MFRLHSRPSDSLHFTFKETQQHDLELVDKKDDIESLTFVYSQPFTIPTVTAT